MQDNVKQKALWIFAGEPSGDAYGARLAEEVLTIRPGLTVQGMGGALMRRAGVDILIDSSDLAVVGLAEVIRKLPQFRRIFYNLKRQALAIRPEAVVLIDYPGFNLRFAAAMYRIGIPVVYYVSPQVWAWGRGRINKIARYVRKLLVLFPFEVEVFAESGVDVEFVGHPMVEMLHQQCQLQPSRERETVLLLPGSRSSEIRRLLPDMLAAAALLHRRRSSLRFIIPLHSPDLEPVLQAELARCRRRGGSAMPNSVEVVTSQTHYWLQRAAAGIAASGTVTMEAAILGLPLAVVYRVHPVTYRFARWLVKIPHIAMPNLVAGHCVYEEFIQGALQPAGVARAVEDILPGGSREKKVQEGMIQVVERLGGRMNTGRHTAEAVVSVIDDARRG